MTEQATCKMRDFAIFGAGGFGREVFCLFDRVNKSSRKWNFIGFFDDGIPCGQQISHYGKVLGGMNRLNSWETELDIVIAIGEPTTVEKVHKKITNTNIHFPNLIDLDFGMVDPKTFSIGHGNIIGSLCYASCDVKIGNFNILNASDGFGHDANVGDYNVFMPDVRVSGEVKIGNANFFGLRSIVIQQLRIGNNVRLGTGAVLMTKPQDNSVYLGNPAKKFKF